MAAAFQRNRRQARRYPFDRELLEVNGKPAQGDRIVDLAMGGARLRLRWVPPLMSQIKVTFTVENQPQPMTLSGRVVWTRASKERGWFEAGIQFYQPFWAIDQTLRSGKK